MKEDTNIKNVKVLLKAGIKNRVGALMGMELKGVVTDTSDGNEILEEFFAKNL